LWAQTSTHVMNLCSTEMSEPPEQIVPYGWTFLHCCLNPLHTGFQLISHNCEYL
jgi:hypothetical protein